MQIRMNTLDTLARDGVHCGNMSLLATFIGISLAERDFHLLLHFGRNKSDKLALKSTQKTMV